MSRANRFALLSDETSAPVSSAPVAAAAPAPAAPAAPEQKGHGQRRSEHSGHKHGGVDAPHGFRRNQDGRGERGGRGRGGHLAHGHRQGYRSLADERAHNDAVASGLAQAPRKREYDHHVAGNNAPRGMKKGGAGPHNWGNQSEPQPTEPVADAEAAPEAAAADADAAAAESAEAKEEAPAAPVEEEDKTLTLSEYMKLQEAKRVAADLERQTREAGEESGILEDEFQEASAYVAADDYSDIIGAVAAAPVKRSAGGKAKADKGIKKMSIDEFVSQASSDKPVYGGKFRGRGRGRGGRSQPVNVNDSSAFPALK